MGSIPDDKIEEILERIDLVDLVSRYVNLKRVGKNYFGLCPFHSEKTPSFSVSPDKQLYHCFGCGASGNAITFLMQIEGLSFTEAVKELADIAGVELTFSRREKEKDFEKNTLREILEAAKKFFIEKLKGPDGVRAREYLKERGINEKTIKEWEIGYAPPGWSDLRTFLRKKKIPDSLSEKAGLIIQGRDGYYDRFRDRIMFPIYDQRNRLVAFGGRVIENKEDSPKYLNSPETPLFNKGRTLFGLNHASSTIARTGEVFLVEGYLDVISLWQAGIKNAVAPLGTGLTAEQVRILSRLAKRVYLSFDGDDAGIKATLRGIELLASVGLEHFVVVLPAGDDPDSFVKREGVEGWEAVKNRGIPGFTFFVEYHMKRTGNTPEGVAKCAGIVADLIGKVEDPVLRDLYIQQSAEMLGVKEEVIAGKVTISNESGEVIREKKWNFYPEEELFLALVLQNPGLLQDRNLVDAERWIVSPLLSDLMAKWKSLVDSGRTSPGFLASGENESIPSLVGYLLAREVKLDDEQIAELVWRMKERKLKLLQQKLSREISMAERRGERERVIELLKKKKEILAQLQQSIVGERGSIS